MGATLEQLRTWMTEPENEHLECKEAKNHFDFEELVKYCAALANERGGVMLLGVTNTVPRKVVGSRAFDNLERTKHGLVDRLHLRIDAGVIDHHAGRVVAFEVPSRPIGMPIQYNGAYWMRAGESLVPMTPDMLKRIFGEAAPDFSAEICPKAVLADLDPQAIENFRALWRRKSGNTALDLLDHTQLLADAELLIDGQISYAALVLLGTRQGLGKHLPQAEVLFEYRATEASIAFQQRREYRQGFFLFDDDLWDTINLRNDVYHYQDGFFVGDIRAFNEVVVREAILNAISHRDYRLGGSTFVRQFPKKLEVVSPGGFPPGITPENILWKQSPRNRRIAETLVRCGLVERSGQGANRMFEESIKESKARPDFTGSDDYEVSLMLWGEVQDPRFLSFLGKVGQETLRTFTTQDFLVLDLVHREQVIPAALRGRLLNLCDIGIIERQGRGRGTRYLLSRRFYSFVGKKGAYTRRRGLDRETNKALLVRHITDNQKEGSQIRELVQVLPAESARTVQRLLSELRVEGRAHYVGYGRALRWYPGPLPDGAAAARKT
ncbi:MAG TPA: ATP-binding protein [Thermomicrobiales bacterium]|nr:ATP-binding protein [Thermomicrobiales bacterium]